jgi:hypothetical protein
MGRAFSFVWLLCLTNDGVNQLCGDGVGSGVEGVLDAVAQDREDGDDNQSDQRDQQAVLYEGLALFFVQKAI